MKINMSIRSLAHVTAGVLAGAALVGIRRVAAASQNDPAPSSRSDMSSMMTSKKSQEQMVGSMSKLMDDPKMRKQMRSMMRGAMGDMSGMGDKKPGQGKSGMNQMHPMTSGSN